MNVIDFPSRKTPDDRPVAHEIKSRGRGAYAIAFKGSGFGVVFEDDGGAAYLYATDERHTEIFDAVHIYDAGTAQQFRRGTPVNIVWHAASGKAGLFVNEGCVAVFDFKARRGYCRSGFPPTSGAWNADHAWVEGIDSDLDPGCNPTPPSS